MRGSGHGLLQALFRQLPEWSVSVRHKSLHGDVETGQDPNWLPMGSTSETQVSLAAVNLQLFAWGRCFSSRRRCRQTWSQQRGVMQSLDSKARIIENDYFVRQLSTVASCRLAYLTDAAHSAHLDVAQGICKRQLSHKIKDHKHSSSHLQPSWHPRAHSMWNRQTTKPMLRRT